MWVLTELEAPVWIKSVLHFRSLIFVFCSLRRLNPATLPRVAAGLWRLPSWEPAVCLASACPCVCSLPCLSRAPRDAARPACGRQKGSRCGHAPAPPALEGVPRQTRVSGKVSWLSFKTETNKQGNSGFQSATGAAPPPWAPPRVSSRPASRPRTARPWP